jgi:SAM-dependent methyltransferase
MVDLLRPEPGDALLDLAAGVGETGFLALPRAQPGGSLFTTDVAPEMVAAARRRAAELGLDGVAFAVADAQSVPLPAEATDGVLCRFGVMLVPDPARALAEIVRVLRPGGRAALAVWAEADRNDWATAGGRSALALGLAPPPDPDAPGPFRLADLERVLPLLRQAGLTLLHEEEVPLRWCYDSLDAWWEVTNDLSRSLRTVLAGLSPRDGAAVRAGAYERLSGYLDRNGRLAIPGVARVLLASA